MNNLKDQGNIPELAISPLEKEWTMKFGPLINGSGIKGFSPHIEVWSSEASNKALSYHSHGIFRYFGKFPPPVARHLIQKYTKEDDLVIDPMCGSGTTGLEALLLNRRAECYDVNPLATLISRVKVTHIEKEKYLKSLNSLLNLISKKKSLRKHVLVGLRNPEHWFLKETILSLSKIKNAIEELDTDQEIRDALTVALLAIVRRVSRATTQQGRLFLDVVTAEKDALPFFEKKANEIIAAIETIPTGHKPKISNKSILDDKSAGKENAQLIICHPPYFNSYKYSGVNSLELSWMGINHADIRKNEVRESFKVGKPEKVSDYVTDMSRGLKNLSSYLKKNGRLALMIGDTVINGQYIPVTKMLLRDLGDVFELENSALRIPKFTEASWAASQRRKGHQVGINLCDLILILKRK